mmetsp:Transcript_15272/g.58076  ORF Transcript_15272/g.58076 Transcript_15272/m.58076 type:complete len:205 (+) Transcript_15272:2502-3116(+)
MSTSSPIPSLQRGAKVPYSCSRATREVDKSASPPRSPKVTRATDRPSVGWRARGPSQSARTASMSTWLRRSRAVSLRSQGTRTPAPYPSSTPSRTGTSSLAPESTGWEALAALQSAPMAFTSTWPPPMTTPSPSSRAIFRPACWPSLASSGMGIKAPAERRRAAWPVHRVSPQASMASMCTSPPRETTRSAFLVGTPTAAACRT